ncbi:MAG: filamentous hemagglutinin N-terminal domain-containing protein [Mariprofundaceae bacterium]|nr:filamentous hemagglutinin N-terminal domain-containing protein [Mariprofundaceae bacterium]
MRFFLMFFMAMSVCTLVQAGVVYDGSLGTAGQLSGNFTVPASAGKQVGNQLFHSFNRFDVLAGESASFTGSAAIQNIISRVTGGSVSQINGLLDSSAMPNANFFLLNPAGIVFGANASLNVGASFHVSTADYLRMADNKKFFSTPQVNEVLSSAAPAAFGFLAGNVGKIQVSATNGLKVAATQSLSLVASDISITSSSLKAAEGTISLVSVASAGEVAYAAGVLNADALLRTGNIQMTKSSASITSSNGGGKIYVRGGKFVMDSSKLHANVYGTGLVGGSIDVAATTFKMLTASLLSAKTQGAGDAGRIFVTAGEMLMSGTSFIEVPTFSAAAGSGGLIDVTASTLTMSNDAHILANTYGLGQGGRIIVNASQSLNLMDNITIQATSTTGASGHAGQIILSGGAISMMQSSTLLTNTKSSGNAGYISINVASFLLKDQASIQSQSLLGATGRSGIIDLSTTLNMQMLDQSKVLANSRSSGLAGQINITVQNNLLMTQDALIHSVSLGSGKGGIIHLNAQLLSMDANANILVSTEGFGHAGDVFIQAQDINLSNGAAIQSTSLGSGNGGLLSIKAGSLVMSNKANLLASTKSSGQAGNISIQAMDMTLSLNAYIRSESLGTGLGGSIGITAQNIWMSDASDIKASSTGVGNAGSIDITGSFLGMQSDALISSSSASTGNAGVITANLSDEVRLQSGSKISTEALLGGGGLMILNARNMLRMEDSLISSQVGSGLGSGGDIRIDPIFVVLNNSVISANAVGGNGGNIRIVAGQLVQSAGSQITASSQFGLDGNIFIDSPEVDVSQGLSDLPVSFLDTSKWATKVCQANAKSSLALQYGDASVYGLNDWQVAPASLNVKSYKETSRAQVYRQNSCRLL